MTALVRFADSHAPALVTAAGARADPLLGILCLQIRNPHTRRAHARAVQEFLAWSEQHVVRSIAEVEQIHVASYIWKSTLANQACP